MQHLFFSLATGVGGGRSLLCVTQTRIKLTVSSGQTFIYLGGASGGHTQPVAVHLEAQIKVNGSPQELNFLGQLVNFLEQAIYLLCKIIAFLLPNS